MERNVDTRGRVDSFDGNSEREKERIMGRGIRVSIDKEPVPNFSSLLERERRPRFLQVLSASISD